MFVVGKRFSPQVQPATMSGTEEESNMSELILCRVARGDIRPLEDSRLEGRDEKEIERWTIFKDVELAAEASLTTHHLKLISLEPPKESVDGGEMLERSIKEGANLGLRAAMAALEGERRDRGSIIDPDWRSRIYLIFPATTLRRVGDGVLVVPCLTSNGLIGRSGGWELRFEEFSKFSSTQSDLYSWARFVALGEERSKWKTPNGSYSDVRYGNGYDYYTDDFK